MEISEFITHIESNIALVAKKVSDITTKCVITMEVILPRNVLLSWK